MAALVALSSPSAAPAATFCVGDPACPPGGIPAASLQAALNVSDSNGQADRVQLGAGAFNAGGSTFSYESTEQLELLGKGGDQTVLTRGGGDGVAVLRLNQMTAPSHVSLSDLGISIPGGNTTFHNIGINMRASATGVRITAAPGVTMATGLNPFGGTVFRSGTIDVPGTGIILQGGGILVEDSTITASSGVSTPFTTSATIRRTRISASSVGLDAGGGSLTASDVLVRPRSPQVLFTGLLAGGGVIGGTTYHGQLIADNVTVVGDGSSGDTGAESRTTNGGTSALTLRSSTVTGFETALRRQQVGGGAASFAVLHSNYLGLIPGVVPGPTNKSVDPGFVGNGDFHLRFDSPLIDAGNPAGNPPPTDLDGQQRPVDGNGDGSAVQDIGALEYQRQPPLAKATSAAAAAAGQPAGFDGSASSDPDPGDKLAYSWSFDDGGGAFGALASHAFASGGNHSAKLTVTDPTGLTASVQVPLQVMEAPEPALDKVAPKLTSASVASPFAVGKRRTARSSQRQRIRRGTAFRFRLSEVSAVRIVIEQVRHGRRRGKRCVKPTPGLRHARRCGRYLPSGTLTRKGLESGRRMIRFSGRIGRCPLRPARYRARLIATDAAGNRSVPRQLGFRVVRARR